MPEYLPENCTKSARKSCLLVNHWPPIANRKQISRSGLIRGSSLSYRSRLCGSRDRTRHSDSSECEAPYARVNQSLQRDEVTGRSRSTAFAARRSRAGFVLDPVEVRMSPEWGEKRRKGEKRFSNYDNNRIAPDSMSEQLPDFPTLVDTVTSLRNATGR